MKKIAFIFSVFSLTFLVRCEKDDICADGTPTTPRLIIGFYDSINTAQEKNVSNLAIIANGVTDTIKFNGVSEIQIPLKTNSDTTTFQFINNGTDDEVNNDNIDEVTFTYTRNDVYVSRACGYKTLFYLDEVFPLSINPDANNWIVNHQIITNQIINEDEIHIKLYF